VEVLDKKRSQISRQKTQINFSINLYGKSVYGAKLGLEEERKAGYTETIRLQRDTTGSPLKIFSTMFKCPTTEEVNYVKGKNSYFGQRKTLKCENRMFRPQPPHPL
jgi:hypothetical protein